MTVEGVLQTVSLVSKLTKNPQIFGEGGEERSGYEVLAARRERNRAGFFDDRSS